VLLLNNFFDMMTKEQHIAYWVNIAEANGVHLRTVILYGSQSITQQNNKP